MINLRKRILSAIIMILIVIPILVIGGIPYSLGVGLIGCIAYKELCDLKRDGDKGLPTLVKIFGLIAMLFLIYFSFENGLLEGISYRMLSIILLFLFIPIVFFYDRYNINDAFNLLSKVLFLGIGFNLLISIYNYNIKYFILLILITTLTDTFALFGGSLIGKHNFTKISPNKTVEGSIIGSLVATFVCTVYYFNIISDTNNIFLVISIVLLLTVVAQIGDLFFSAIKREYKIKDFSDLIPGHGGILDRLDSLIFVMLAFTMVILYI